MSTQLAYIQQARAESVEFGLDNRICELVVTMGNLATTGRKEALRFITRPSVA